MKILVAIANHGTKNMKYLHRLLDEYRSYRNHRADVVILSNVPKELGPDIEVVVGTPIKDPWSLPFGHKQLFADRVDQYDLFIYSEDDTLITERNIEAFLRATAVLPENCIAGFVRYEESPEGQRFYSTFHSGYHWDPNSVVRHGDMTFAYYTNEHAACFILTKAQLKRSLKSGGFMLPARKGRYDMLVTAATDPYVHCGMKKLVCISSLEDFSLPHLPNVYIGRMGLDAAVALREVEHLKEICGKNGARGPLFNTSVELDEEGWDKLYYEPVRSDVLALIPKEAKTLLSVGCGCGTTEAELVKLGVRVTAVPLDCVVQVTAEAKGIKTVAPDFKAAREALRGQKFDCLLFKDVLQHLPVPVSTLQEFLPFLEQQGSVVLSVVNFGHGSILRRRLPGQSSAFKPGDRRSFEKHRLHFTTRGMVRSWLKRCGLKVSQIRCPVSARYQRVSRLTLGKLDSLLGRKLLVLAKRNSP